MGGNIVKNKEYWAQRLEEMIVRAELSVLEFEKSLIEAYEIALAVIRKEIDAFYHKYARENKITYADARRRLNDRERRSFIALVKEWLQLADTLELSNEYKEYLVGLLQRVYLSRMETLEASIRNEIEKVKMKQYAWMTDLLQTNYIVAYYDNYYTMAQGLEDEIIFVNLDKTDMDKAMRTRWSGANYSTRLWNDRDAIAKQLQTLIPQAFARGLTSNQLADMLAKEFNTSKNRARALVRTEVNFITNQAVLESYKAARIKYYEYTAVLDMRTSEICRSLHGKVFKVSEAKVGVNYPPMHPNCRSTTFAYFPNGASDYRIDKDSGNTIKTPRRMSQEQWIKRFVSDEYQERILSFMKKYVVEE